VPSVPPRGPISSVAAKEYSTAAAKAQILAAVPARLQNNLKLPVVYKHPGAHLQYSRPVVQFGASDEVRLSRSTVSWKHNKSCLSSLLATRYSLFCKVAPVVRDVVHEIVREGWLRTSKKPAIYSVVIWFWEWREGNQVGSIQVGRADTDGNETIEMRPVRVLRSWVRTKMCVRIPPARRYINRPPTPPAPHPV